MTMIERVARALCVAGFEGYDPDGIVTHKPAPVGSGLAADGMADEFEYLDQSTGEVVSRWRHWRLYERQARSVINAMREPSEEMKLAGAFCEPFMMPEGEKYTPGQIIAHSCYTAMIDAALKD